MESGRDAHSSNPWSASASAFLTSIIDNSSDLISIKDREGRFVLVNDRFCALAGLPRERLLGRTPHDIFPPAVAEEHLANDQRVFDRGVPMSFVEHAELEDGPHAYTSIKFPVRDDNGAMIAVGGISVDITAQRAVEVSLRESEEKFRLAFHLNPLSINLNRLSDGTFIDINEGFTRLTGYEREEVIGKTSSELDIWVDPEDRRRLVSEMASGRVDNLRARFRRKSGEIAVGVMSATVLRIRDETVILSLTRDITREIELEDRYRQSQKMEVVGQLAGGIAHDFNNLLIPVMGYSEMLVDSLAPDDERRHMAAEILEAGRRASELTRQILTFSRKQVMDMRPVDVNQLVSGFRAMIRRLLAETIELRMVLAPASPTVLADRTQIEQILMNLAVNAADAMPLGGTLTIETGTGLQDLEAGGRFAVPVSDGVHAVITVRDDGTGMNAETMEHLFEPFFTTKDVGKGTGLGLATVYGVVKQHQGNVWVSSRPGAGAVFKVFLPLSAAGESGVRDVPTPSSRHGSETVLVVEDDVHVRRFVCGALENDGYVVLAAATADDALRMSGAWAAEEVPQLLLTDVIMPGASGRELHAAITARFPSLRAIFMSGHTKEVFARFGVHETAIELLRKPFGVEDLLSRVRAVLDR